MPPIASKQLDRIEAAIIGNGQEGLLARTARIEEKLKTAADLAEGAKVAAEEAAEKADTAVTRAANAVNLLTQTVTKLEGMLSSHIGTDHLSVLMRKKSFWTLIIIGYVSLHLIATYVPNLWDTIVIFLGIPKLVLPIPK